MKPATAREKRQLLGFCRALNIGPRRADGSFEPFSQWGALFDYWLELIRAVNAAGRPAPRDDGGTRWTLNNCERSCVCRRLERVAKAAKVVTDNGCGSGIYPTGWDALRAALAELEKVP